MNVNITITHTIAPEVIDILKNFSKGLDPLQTTQVAEVVQEPAKMKKKLAVVAEATSQNSNQPEVVEEEKADTEISAEVLRAKTAEIIQSNKRSQVAQLLTEFGVGKLTELPKDQFSAFYKKLVKL